MTRLPNLVKIYLILTIAKFSKDIFNFNNANTLYLIRVTGYVKIMFHDFLDFKAGYKRTGEDFIMFKIKF